MLSSIFNTRATKFKGAGRDAGGTKNEGKGTQLRVGRA
jgi:hypothetical protein